MGLGGSDSESALKVEPPGVGSGHEVGGRGHQAGQLETSGLGQSVSRHLVGTEDDEGAAQARRGAQSWGSFQA